MRDRYRFSAGFTLVELMVTVAVAAVILGVAGPKLAEFIARTRVATATNEFVFLINYGRTEAIKRSTQVVVCRSTDGTACDGESWGDGAVAFVDNDRNDTLGAGDEVLRTLTDVSDALTLTSGNLAQRIVFTPAGSVEQNGQIALVGGDHAKLKRCLHIAPSGRVEAKAYYAECGSA